MIIVSKCTISFSGLDSIGEIYLDSNAPDSSMKINDIFHRLCEEQKSVSGYLPLFMNLIIL